MWSIENALVSYGFGIFFGHILLNTNLSILDETPRKPAHLKERKELSATGLLATVRGCFENIADHRDASSVTYTILDSLMSGLAIFGMKFPSLLQFDKMSRSDEYVMHNLKSLYGLSDTPSDTRVREIIDPIDSKTIRPTFKKIFASLQRGKAIEDYQAFPSCQSFKVQ